jgi:hypothetical protein
VHTKQLHVTKCYTRKLGFELGKWHTSLQFKFQCEQKDKLKTGNIPADAIIHSHGHENQKSYRSINYQSDLAGVQQVRGRVQLNQQMNIHFFMGM